MVRVLLKLFLEQGEQLVISLNEFFPIFLCDTWQVADHPAFRFEFPFIRQAEKTIISADIGEERKLPATQGAKIALTLGWTQACQQYQPCSSGYPLLGERSPLKLYAHMHLRAIAAKDQCSLQEPSIRSYTPLGPRDKYHSKTACHSGCAARTSCRNRIQQWRS